MKKILSVSIMGLMLSLSQGAWAQQGPYPTALTDGTYGPVGQVTPNSNTNEFELYNAVNTLLGTSYSNNAQIDNMEVGGSITSWTQPATNGSFAIIGLGAANNNTVEVYNTATPGTLVNPLGGGLSGNGATGSGTQSSPYVGASTSFSAGTQFGFALNTVGIANLSGSQTTGSSGNTWYSDPTLNSDKVDHMIVYNLSGLNGTQIYIDNPSTSTEQEITLENPYLVGVEDLNLSNNGAGSDLDFNDTMFLVNGAAPTSAVPEPATWGLLAVGLGAMALFTRRKLGMLS